MDQEVRDQSVTDDSRVISTEQVEVLLKTKHITCYPFWVITQDVSVFSQIVLWIVGTSIVYAKSMETLGFVLIFVPTYIFAFLILLLLIISQWRKGSFLMIIFTIAMIIALAFCIYIVIAFKSMGVTIIVLSATSLGLNVYTIIVAIFLSIKFIRLDQAMSEPKK